MPDITIPADLLPADGRFGSGPTKVRPEAARALADRATDYLGTSHRQLPVRLMVAELRNGIAELLRAPDGYEIMLGNGGSTGFWDCATFCLIERRSHHLDFGEFGGKFAKAVAAAPHLATPSLTTSEPGTHPPLDAVTDVDAYCFPHNETSTGVMLDPVRVDDPGALMMVDATSAAGGLHFDASATDVYYFAPQKALAADGGLWIAMVSPAAIERIERISASDRWCPPSLDLEIALENSRKDQTYNTPALATVFLTVQTVNWFNDNGGLSWSAGRSRQSAEILYSWVAARDFVDPFVQVESQRSLVVATIDFDPAVSADTISAVLRANGIVDTGGYRKLGRNQLRIGMFPAIEPSDVEALTRCLDHVVGALS
ncbi:MAG: phosphoserine transaminase [Actinobacteria bacterium]|nr:phosphoserine transaminase [Actinomycetota bacterium]NIS34602.1 phosphoserine transaminase [Actinomycetota bacterium]NIT94212.1 phosphoserine transaminase [Actinomycetota bacterium]NIU17819.1 phosphoserine transaminase [Actinomycetota bacterium]NIU69362.1 phosphoserine transaminase [Actinomycetota bacterium]